MPRSLARGGRERKPASEKQEPQRGDPLGDWPHVGNKQQGEKNVFIC